MIYLSTHEKVDGWIPAFAGMATMIAPGRIQQTRNPHVLITTLCSASRRR
jgi:hypothetical protein